MAGKSDQLDMEKAKQVAQNIVGDIASTVHAALCFIGDRLGLFKAMAGAGPLTVEQLAQKTGLSERYIREWLSAMVAGRYVGYDPELPTHTLTPDSAAALADNASPLFVGRYFHMAAALVPFAPHH